jgi:hypothetical protein
MIHRALPQIYFSGLRILKETYKALVLQGVLPTFDMRPVTGLPLQAGTYIQELLDAPGRYTTVTSDQPKMVLTNDPRSDAVKVRVFKNM